MIRYCGHMNVYLYIPINLFLCLLSLNWFVSGQQFAKGRSKKWRQSHSTQHFNGILQTPASRFLTVSQPLFSKNNLLKWHGVGHAIDCYDARKFQAGYFMFFILNRDNGFGLTSIRLAYLTT